MKKYLYPLLGTFLFSIPWLIVYVLFNYLVVYLAFLIVFGGIIFYKKFVGELDKKSYIIIFISSLLVVTLNEFILIPAIMYLKESGNININNIINMYNNKEILNALIHDYLISIFFVIISFFFINKKDDNGDFPGYVDLSNPEYQDRLIQVEEVYKKYNAFSKENAVSEMKVLKELKFKNKFQFMAMLEQNGVIVAPYFKSYFDKEAITSLDKKKQNKKNNVIPALIVSFSIVLILFVVGFSLLYIFDSNESIDTKEETVVYKEYKFKSLKFKLPSDYTLDSDAESYQEYYSVTSPVSGIFLDYYNTSSYEEYNNRYYDYLKESYNIIDSYDLEIDSIKFKGYLTNSKKYPDEYYLIYINNQILDGSYIITFYNKYKDVKDKEYNKLIDESNNYLNNIKIDMSVDG